MASIIPNWLSDDECNFYINYYKNNPDKIFRETNEFVKNYEGIEISNDNEFPFFKLIPKSVIEYFRIQKTDVYVQPINNPHTHETPYNFVIFLNENFEGGNLVFDDMIVTPKVGTMVFFEGNERHYPTPVTSGERWVIACFLNSWINPYKTLM